MNGTVCPAAPNNRRYKITDLNPHLMCVLCGGYYIDATTIIECLHSFCRTCIVRCLETSKFCPICDVQVHKTKPLLNIRSDQTLQDIVYKLVPGLFQREMKRRRNFYAEHPQECSKTSNPRSNEERGEVDSDFSANIFMPDEFISIALEYSESPPVSNGLPKKEGGREKSSTNFQRFLRCPVYTTVAHIKKLIRAKCGLSSDCDVDLMVTLDRLSDDYMLMDVAYMYSWKRKGPLKLYFSIVKQPIKRLTMSPFNFTSFYSNQRTKTNGVPTPTASAASAVKTEVSAAAAASAVVAVVTVGNNGGCLNNLSNQNTAAIDKAVADAGATVCVERTTNGASAASPQLKTEAADIVPAKMETTPQRTREDQSDSARPRKRIKLDAEADGDAMNTATTSETNNNDSGVEDREVAVVAPASIMPVKSVEETATKASPPAAVPGVTNGVCVAGAGDDGGAAEREIKTQSDSKCSGDSSVAIPMSNGLPASDTAGSTGTSVPKK